MGTALRLYGPDRLRKLDLAIRRAGQPDGITVMSYIRRQTGFIVLALVVFVIALLIGQPLLGAGMGILLIVWMRMWLHSTAAKRDRKSTRLNSSHVAIS